MSIFGDLTLSCCIDGCGLTITVPRPVLPTGWTETEDGAVCPRHRPRVVVEDVPPEDAHEEALRLDGRRQPAPS